MPTRNFYAGVSRTFGPHQRSLKFALLAVWLGGFALLAAVALLLKAESALLVLGKLWFTSCVLLGIVYGCTHWFSPERDPLDSSPTESWSAIVINLGVLLTAWVWIWVD